MRKTGRKFNDAKSEWQPSPRYIEQYKTSILKKLTSSGGVYDLNNRKTKPVKSIQYLEQYARVGAFLQHKDQVEIQLKTLNDLLFQEADTEGLVMANKKGHPVIKPAVDDKNYASHRKLLTRVLGRELAFFGFQPKLVKLNGVLGSGMFGELVGNGYLFKDSGLRDTTHGEFTHTIQWLLLAWQLEEFDFFDNVPVIAVYKSLGDDRTILESDSLDIPGLREAGINIWDFIVDTVPAYPGGRVDLSRIDYVQKPYDRPDTDPRGYTVPNNLNYFLMNNELPELSFLTSLIISRETKRAMEADKKLEISATMTPKHHKTVFPNTRYTLYSADVELPVDEKNPVYKKLALQTEIKEFAISTTAEADLKQTASQKKFTHGKSLFEKADYVTAIKIFKSIENDFVSLGISQQHNGYYYLGFSYTRINQAAEADVYLRKARSVGAAAEMDGRITQDFISKKMVISELGIAQHILRAKKAVTRNSEQEHDSTCLIC